MPTVSHTISIMKISQYLASADIAKGALFGQRNDPRLPIMLYVERKGLEKISTLDPAYPDIQAVSDYCYALCWAYAASAEYIFTGGGGGSVNPPTGVQGYPIYITQANFTTPTLYPNTKLFGTNTIVFLNEINRYLIPYIEFFVDINGLNITLDGFDATQFAYNLVIEKVYDN